jgi:two-component system, NtrC family, nitrogen regulation response regulator NtrX
MTARILIVDDEADIRGLLREILAEEGYEVDIAANAVQARAARIRQVPDLVLLDIWMPDIDGITLLREWSASVTPQCPVVMMSGHGTVETAVEATRLGAFDYVEKPLSLAKLLRTVERALDLGKQRRQSGKLFNLRPAALLGSSRVLRHLRSELQQLSSGSMPVLFMGESGTGREALARHLHEQSPRAARAFSVIAAHSLRDTDAELQLLGREKADGSTEFGLIESAQDGSLYIDGIEDLPPAAQRVLVAVLETGFFRRLNSLQPVKFEARILAATRPTTVFAIDTMPVRHELLAKLQTFTVQVPALRDYAEDIPELLRHHIEHAADAQSLPLRSFSVAAQNRLRNYPWPGNIRELKERVQRLLRQPGAEEISLEEVEADIARQKPSNSSFIESDVLALPMREAREQFERAYLTQQLALCDGRVGKLAKRISMERTHLYRKLRLLGIDFRSNADE